MVAENGVLFQSVQRVPGDVLTSVSVMAGARDANLKIVERVLRVALISARPTVEGRDAHGVFLVLNLTKETVTATHFARGKTGLCASHSALLQDRRVHGGATLGTTAQDCNNNPPAKMKQLFTVEDMNVDNAVTSSSGWKFPDLPQVHFPVESNPSPSKASEGRVHGGNFMALFAGNQVSRGEAGPSQEPIGTAHQPWM